MSTSYDLSRPVPASVSMDAMQDAPLLLDFRLIKAPSPLMSANESRKRFMDNKSVAVCETKAPGTDLGAASLGQAKIPVCHRACLRATTAQLEVGMMRSLHLSDVPVMEA